MDEAHFDYFEADFMRQFQRHPECSLHFEDFGTLEQKAEYCPVCLKLDHDWHCLGASHPRQSGKY